MLYRGVVRGKKVLYRRELTDFYCEKIDEGSGWVGVVERDSDKVISGRSFRSGSCLTPVRPLPDVLRFLTVKVTVGCYSISKHYQR